MIKTRARGMKVAAVAAIGFLLAGVGVTAASATDAQVSIAEECVASDAWTETVIDKPAVDDVTELRW